MADTKISALTAASTPLAGSEVLPIVQSGVTVKVSVDNLTAGKAVSCSTLGVGTTSLLGGALSEFRQNADASYSTTFTTGTTKTQLVLRDLSDVGTYAIPFSTLALASGSTGAAWSTISSIRTAAQTSALTFSTSNGSSNPVERVRIGVADMTINDGNLVIGTSGKGIDFSATSGTGTSELLADYEEGTWTPVVAGSSTAGTYELQSSSATYTKIGRQVTLICFVRLAAAITGGGAGSLSITGLPFAKSSGPYPVGQVVFDSVDWTAGANLACSFGTVSPASIIYFEQTNDNAGATFVPISGVSANDYIFFSITYWA